jgi:hypothetical protein
MKYILDFFALVGLCASIIAAGIYMGYTSYEPKCGTVAALLTEHCK